METHRKAFKAGMRAAEERKGVYSNPYRRQRELADSWDQGLEQGRYRLDSRLDKEIRRALKQHPEYSGRSIELFTLAYKDAASRTGPLPMCTDEELPAYLDGFHLAADRFGIAPAYVDDLAELAGKIGYRYNRVKQTGAIPLCNKAPGHVGWPKTWEETISAASEALNEPRNAGILPILRKVFTDGFLRFYSPMAADHINPETDPQRHRAWDMGWNAAAHRHGFHWRLRFVIGAYPEPAVTNAEAESAIFGDVKIPNLRMKQYPTCEACGSMSGIHHPECSVLNAKVEEIRAKAGAAFDELATESWDTIIADLDGTGRCKACGSTAPDHATGCSLSFAEIELPAEPIDRGPGAPFETNYSDTPAEIELGPEARIEPDGNETPARELFKPGAPVTFPPGAALDWTKVMPLETIEPATPEERELAWRSSADRIDIDVEPIDDRHSWVVFKWNGQPDVTSSSIAHPPGASRSDIIGLYRTRELADRERWANYRATELARAALTPEDKASLAELEPPTPEGTKEVPYVEGGGNAYPPSAADSNDDQRRAIIEELLDLPGNVPLEPNPEPPTIAGDGPERSIASESIYISVESPEEAERLADALSAEIGRRVEPEAILGCRCGEAILRRQARGPQHLRNCPRWSRLEDALDGGGNPILYPDQRARVELDGKDVSADVKTIKLEYEYGGAAETPETIQPPHLPPANNLERKTIADTARDLSVEELGRTAARNFDPGPWRLGFESGFIAFYDNARQRIEQKPNAATRAGFQGGWEKAAILYAAKGPWYEA